VYVKLELPPRVIEDGIDTVANFGTCSSVYDYNDNPFGSLSLRDYAQEGSVEAWSPRCVQYGYGQRRTYFLVAVLDQLNTFDVIQGESQLGRDS
jgi:hypothetical protein